MARTPYEIRLDTLCLARDILSDNAAAERFSLEQRRAYTVVRGNVVEEEDKERSADLFDPCTFTADDVLANATKLLAFVNDDPHKEPASQLPTG